LHIGNAEKSKGCATLFRICKLLLQIHTKRLVVKHGIDIGVGVIVKDYQEAMKVVLINNSTILFQVRPGDRIAQLILEKILRADPKETKNLSEMIRSTQGFESTGLEEILNM
jgi:dUTP pyrophosphatase